MEISRNFRYGSYTLLSAFYPTGKGFAIHDRHDSIPYAGMYIVEKEDNNEYELIDAMRILRSGEFKEYVFKVGIPISGKSVRITSKDVENYMF